jgi:hypothetical protein
VVLVVSALQVQKPVVMVPPTLAAVEAVAVAVVVAEPTDMAAKAVVVW